MPRRFSTLLFALLVALGSSAGAEILPFEATTTLMAVLAIASVAAWVALYRLVRVTATPARVALSVARSWSVTRTSTVNAPSSG